MVVARVFQFVAFSSMLPVSKGEAFLLQVGKPPYTLNVSSSNITATP